MCAKYKLIRPNRFVCPKSLETSPLGGGTNAGIIVDNPRKRVRKWLKLMVENRLPKPLLAGILLVVALGIFFVARAFLPQGETRAASLSAMEKDPNTKFMMDMAKKCQGDFSKLSQADQQAVLARNGGNHGYAVTYMKRMYRPGK